MRSLGVCCILLALAIVAPPPALRSGYEGLWSLGTLVLLGVTAQNVARRLRLPPLTGWILAGLVLGPSLLQAAVPQRVPLLHLVGDLAGVWAGFLVALGSRWPEGRRTWALPGIVAASTGLSFALIGGGLAVLTDLPLATAFLFAALLSLWGPLITDTWGDYEARLVCLLGVGAAGLWLSAVVLLGFGADGQAWVARLWLSAGVGAVVAEGLWRGGVFARRSAALLALGGASVAAAMASQHFGVPTVPIGLGAGLVLAAHEDTSRQLGHLLAPARTRAMLVFGAILVASVDVVGYWPLPSGLLEILGVQLVVLVLLRGVGPLFWYPPGLAARARSSWRLLPKGLVAAELVLAAGAVLPGLLPAAQAHLLRSVVLADLVLSALGIGALVGLVPMRSAEPATGPAPAAAPALAPEVDDTVAATPAD